MGLLDGIAPTSTNSFIKGVEFEGNGLKLKVSKTPEKIEANDPKFGWPDGPDKGKTIKFYFEQDGKERTFESKSARFIQAFNAVAVVGEEIVIRRTGTGTDTQYFAQSAGTADQTLTAPPEDEIDINDINF